MLQEQNILTIEGLSKYFGGIHALENLDIVIKKGQIHGLIGPNGSGKTTLFNVITGLLLAKRGNVFYKSKKITNIQSDVITKMGISRTFQAGLIVPNMTTLENVMCGAYSWTNIDILGTFFRCFGVLSKQERKIKQQALELLQLVGIEKSAERWAKELVWVERQLVQIARALASKPEIILLDEPTGGMGTKESERVGEIIKKVRGEMGITVFFIEHDVNLVTALSDWITCINFGKKICEGSPKKVRKDKKVLEAYLGKEYQDSRCK